MDDVACLQFKGCGICRRLSWLCGGCHRKDTGVIPAVFESAGLDFVPGSEGKVDRFEKVNYIYIYIYSSPASSKVMAHKQNALQ